MAGDISRTTTPGVLVFDPALIPDERGVFYEGIRTEEVEAAGEALFRPHQINYSVSRRNTLRGVHGFLSLADDTCVCYVLSTAHVQGTQVDIDPLDPELDLPWGFTEHPLMSEKDAQAGGVAAAATAGLLPLWKETCGETRGGYPAGRSVT